MDAGQTAGGTGLELIHHRQQILGRAAWEADEEPWALCSSPQLPLSLIPTELHQILTAHQARWSSAKHPPSRAALSCGHQCQCTMQMPAQGSRALDCQWPPPVPLQLPTSSLTRDQPSIRRDNRSRNHLVMPLLSGSVLWQPKTGASIQEQQRRGPA